MSKIPDEIKVKMDYAIKNYYTVGGYVSETQASNIIQHGYHLASEQIQEKDKQIAELKEWKSQAIEVMVDFQEIGKAMNVGLGETVHDKILPHIKSQSATIAKLREGLEKIAQMSDPGDPFKGIVYMKNIACDLLSETK